MQALREACGPRAQMLRAWPINLFICALKLLILPRIARVRVCAILLAAAGRPLQALTLPRARAFARTRAKHPAFAFGLRILPQSLSRSRLAARRSFITTLRKQSLLSFAVFACFAHPAARCFKVSFFSSPCDPLGGAYGGSRSGRLSGRVRRHASSHPVWPSGSGLPWF